MPSKSSAKITSICKQCSKPFNHYKALRASNNKFCSRACWTASREFPGRIWKFVNKTDSCWLWTGGGTNEGYGLCKGPFGHALAHRVIWELIKGPIPPGMDLCHNCPGGDNPVCVNPDHHFIGTRQDNLNDAVKKGRMAKGEQIPQSKLKAADIPVIRKMLKTIGVTAVAKCFPVSAAMISKIKHGKSWKHII